MIAYKHKQTGCIVTTEELKVHLQKDYRLVFNKVEPIFPFSLEEEIRQVKKYEYNIKDIPFSEDFIAFELDNEFDVRELSYLIHMLNVDMYKPDFASDITNKLVRKKENKLLMR